MAPLRTDVPVLNSSLSKPNCLKFIIADCSDSRITFPDFAAFTEFAVPSLNVAGFNTDINDEADDHEHDMIFDIIVHDDVTDYSLGLHSVN